MSVSTFTLGIAAIDYVLAGSNLFENSDNVTFMLVRNFTGVVLADLDSDDNGVFNTVVPWTEVVDTIALIKTTTVPPTGTEWYYGPNTIGPDGTFVPGHIWRCEDTGCWNIGKFDTLAADPTDTPGVANLNCGALCAGDYNLDGIRNGSDLELKAEISPATERHLVPISLLCSAVGALAHKLIFDQITHPSVERLGGFYLSFHSFTIE